MGQKQLEFGRQGRCLHAHMHRAQGIHCCQSRYAQANCHAVQTCLTGDGAQPSQSGAGAVTQLSWRARLV